jgi:integrase
MRKALSDKTVQSLKPLAKRYEVRDCHCPGFGIRVSPEGRKTFFASYRYGLKQRRLKLGVYPRITLAKAREKALDALRQVDEGIDPAGRRRQPGLIVEAVVADFIRQYAKPRNRNWRETERTLTRELVGLFGQRDIRAITRPHILEIIDAAIERGAHYQANRILATLRKLFNWSIERGIIESNPMHGLKAPTREQSRSRALDDDEVTRLVRACRADPYPFGPFVLMLLATSQRRGELAEMRWSEINRATATWEIPAERSKNGKPHTVPLSPIALSILGAIPRFATCDLVFTTTRKSPVSGFSKMVRRLSEASETSDWRLHDLRRTAASGMAKAGVAPHVVEKVLNHVSGTISGVAAVYNRYGYDAEKRDALNKWGLVLETLSE